MSIIRLLLALLIGILFAGLAQPASAAPITFLDRPAVYSFDDNLMPSTWSAIEGNWTVAGNRLIATPVNPAQQPLLSFSDSRSDFRIDLDVTYQALRGGDTSRWLGVAWGLSADSPLDYNVGQVRFNSTAANGLGLLRHVATASVWADLDNTSAPRNASLNVPTHLTLEVHGTRATWWFDGQPSSTTYRARDAKEGSIGLISNGVTAAFDNIVISPLEAEVDLPFTKLAAPGQNPSMVAHRGTTMGAPENTISAIRYADSLQPQAIEFDVRYSKDGVPFLMHDETVDRTTNGHGRVSDLTSVELSQLDAGTWFNPKFAGEPVPTLEQIGLLFVGSPSGLLVDIKDNLTMKQALELVRLLAPVEPQRVFLQSDSLQVIARLRVANPAMNRVLIAERSGGTPESLVSRLRSAGANAVNLPYPEIRLSPSLPALLHTNDIGVAIWDRNDICDWASAEQLGVDMIGINDLKSYHDWTVLGEAAPAIVSLNAGELTEGESLHIRVSSMPRNQALSVSLDDESNYLFQGKTDCSGAAQLSFEFPGLHPGRHELLAIDGDGVTQAASTFVMAPPQRSPDAPKEPSPVDFADDAVSRPENLSSPPDTLSSPHPNEGPPADTSRDTSVDQAAETAESTTDIGVASEGNSSDEGGTGPDDITDEPTVKSSASPTSSPAASAPVRSAPGLSIAPFLVAGGGVLLFALAAGWTWRRRVGRR